eukprot:TRINITY_DN6890_c0_g1_i4.p1 TRINITY_DN6890_c0_g1~~TRINITY_DN6890_c0_g1_i4.p1  ORF type:complete len:181 (-),score=45.82 TRINITY_DN6890_c0_g1_i4:103-645(-)
MCIRDSPTAATVNYKEDPFEKSSNNQFYNPEVSDYTSGDNPVPSEGPILAGFKWAEEFNQKLPGAKPVKMIHICSNYNRKLVYDGTSRDGRRIMIENGYIGAPCVCDDVLKRLTPNERKNYEGNECHHGGMMYDYRFMEVFKDVVLGDTRIEKDLNKAAYFRMTSQEVNHILKICSIIRS